MTGRIRPKILIFIAICGGTALMADVGRAQSCSEQNVEQLKRILQRSGNWDERLCAINTLQMMGPAAEAAIPKLIDEFRVGDTMNDRAEKINQATVEALASIGKVAVPALIAAIDLKPRNFYVTDSAAKALIKIGPPALDNLIAHLKDCDRRDRIPEILVAIRPVDPKTISTLVEVVSGDASCKSSSIASADAEITVTTYGFSELTAKALAESAPEVRTVAVPLLIKALSSEGLYPRFDKSETAVIPRTGRGRIAQTLASIGAKEAIPEFQKFLDPKTNNEVSSASLRGIISALGTMGPDAGGSIPKLVVLVTDDETDLDVRDVAVDALGNIAETLDDQPHQLSAADLNRRISDLSDASIAVAALPSSGLKGHAEPKIRESLEHLETEKKTRWSFDPSKYIQFLWIPVGLAILILFSTRWVFLLLQLEIEPIKTIAPWFYLKWLGREKLYRGYRRTLRKNPEIQANAQRYVDLPYESDSTHLHGNLSDQFEHLNVNQRIAVIADGGRGKSTLCHALTLSAVDGKMLFGRKRLEPVIVDGLAYTGKLSESITAALKQNRAYVNGTIMESQLHAGNLFVLFDGFSEIREAHRATAESDISDFVRHHPDTPILFTSRSALPPTVRQALGDLLTITLQDVDEGTERAFLIQYLKRELDVDPLLTQIKLRFPTLPRIPLMLRMVAEVYNKRDEVPKDLIALFRDYSEHILRREATGIDEPAGLNFAIRHLVHETYLQSEGDRGFTIDQGVVILETIKDRLESYDIKLSPVAVINLLTRAGFYRRTGEQLRFFHDSFESYFAARALESDFRNKQYEMLTRCGGNDRLAETWDFLKRMLLETDDLGKLELLISNAEIGPKQWKIKHLIEQLKLPHPIAQAEAARSLGGMKMEPGIEEAVPELQKLLAGADEAVLKSVSKALGDIGPAAAPAVTA